MKMVAIKGQKALNQVIILYVHSLTKTTIVKSYEGATSHRSE
jgi:hypothetical protein